MNDQEFWEDKSRSETTLKEVSEHFVASDDVAFVAVQTVFEGFGANTSEKALATVQSFDLDIPVGHDTGSDNRHSTLMARYRSGGTPWTIIIDRDGIVQFNGFQIESKEAIRLIDRLLDDLHLLLNHFADFEVLQFDQLLDAISDDPAAALVEPLSGTDVIPAEPDQASIQASIVLQHPSLVAFS